MENIEKVKPVIPLDYYLESLHKLNSMGVKFITYNDLEFENDYDFENGYPDEFTRWNQKIKERNDKNIYVLIQHDTDAGFQSTISLSKHEKKLNAVASIMTFARWQGGDEKGKVESYPISFNELRKLQSEGFMIGYHCNALHTSDFDENLVYENFYKDILILKEFNISFFSPHGGKVLDGIGNVSFDYMTDIRNGGYKKFYPNEDTHKYFKKLRWIHNKFTCKFNGYYSDGGLRRRLQINQENTDLNEFIKNMQPGKRYRMLIHPQYYGDGELQRFETDLEWYNLLF